MVRKIADRRRDQSERCQQRTRVAALERPTKRPTAACARSHMQLNLFAKLVRDLQIGPARERQQIQQVTSLPRFRVQHLSNKRVRTPMDRSASSAFT
jgi:hypothetical protein